MTFEILRKDKATEILLTLLRGAKGIREIQQGIGGSYSTIYDRLNELKQENLIKEEILNGREYGKIPPSRRLIKLTQNGTELVQFMINSGLTKPLSLSKLRQSWIIAILHILGIVSGTTRLMKLLFILKNELGFSKRELKGFYHFRAGKYGPFSQGVEKDLDELQNYGFIEVEVKPVQVNEFSEELGYLHIYSLNPKQKDIVQEAIENLPSNTPASLTKLEVFNRMPMIKLLQYVYVNYPKYIKNSIIVERVLHNQDR